MVSDFKELRNILTNLPNENTKALKSCQTREAQLTKPTGSLGRLESISEWYFSWSNGNQIKHPRVAIFAANHGVTKQGISAFPSEVTQQMVANFASGGACVNQLCSLHDIDLRVYEMNLEQATEDFSQAPAMNEQQTCLAIAYGMMAVEENIDFLCLGEMGIGNTCSAAALSHALFGGNAQDWTGPGTGVKGQALAKKKTIVENSVAKHKQAIANDPLQALRHVGGFELCAIIGAIIAARMARVPVLLDGYVCTAAAAVLHALLGENGLAHCLVGHNSAEPAHAKLCETLNKQAILDLNMRLGEGSGAVLAFSIVKAAISCHLNMATFAEASVSGKKA